MLQYSYPAELLLLKPVDATMFLSAVLQTLIYLRTEYSAKDIETNVLMYILQFH